MSSVDVAVGVVDGKVIVKWQTPVDQIEFDAQNAYLVGVALCKAALEAHRGHSGNGTDDLMFIAEELASQRIEITDIQRLSLVNQVSTILKTFQEQGKSPGYMALHAVDTVLKETAR